MLRRFFENLVIVLIIFVAIALFLGCLLGFAFLGGWLGSYFDANGYSEATGQYEYETWHSATGAVIGGIVGFGIAVAAAVTFFDEF